MDIRRSSADVDSGASWAYANATPMRSTTRRVRINYGAKAGVENRPCSPYCSHVSDHAPAASGCRSAHP